MTEDMERTRNEILAQVLLDPAVACATVVALGGEEALRKKISQEISALSDSLHAGLLPNGGGLMQRLALIHRYKEITSV